MRTPTLAGASALALSLAPAAAPALTPEAAWRNWQEAAGDAGVALEVGGRDLAGDTLTLSGVAFAAETEDGMTVTGSMEEVVFAGQGDGSVAVTLPDSYPVTLSGPNEAGATGRVALTITHPGLAVVMSDAEEGGVATDYAAPEIAVAIDEVAEDGAVQDLAGGVTMTDVSGRKPAPAGTCRGSRASSRPGRSRPPSRAPTPKAAAVSTWRSRRRTCARNPPVR